jgi:hypothetical protein
MYEDFFRTHSLLKPHKDRNSVQLDSEVEKPQLSRNNAMAKNSAISSSVEVAVCAVLKPALVMCQLPTRM